ncbi:polysaccharide deacetylase family protein [candidate division KSB1 bacterium]|nr:polysaccharide deacetylase family protein [candidate division KSB1 bacterium]
METREIPGNKLTDKAFEWIIKHNDNKLVMGLVTFSLPQLFLKWILNHNKNHKSAFGGKACITLSFDCDYEEDVAAFPRLLDLISPYPFKTSFAIVGNWVERFPGEHKLIVDAGHEIVNHTYSHPDNEILNPGRKFKYLSITDKTEEITRCHEVIYNILGVEPTGCRIPHFRNFFSDDIYKILKSLNYKYSSSTLLVNTASYGLPFQAENGIWEFPLSTCPKHPFTVFDTWHSFNSRHPAYRLIHRSEAQFVRLFKLLVDIGIETQSYLNIYFDPLDVPRMKHFKEMLDYVNQKSSVLCVKTYSELVHTLDSTNSMTH